MSLHFLGVQSMSVGLFHVPRTRSLVPAIEGAHVGRFCPDPLSPCLHQGGEGVWRGGQGSAVAVAPLHRCNSLAVSFHTDWVG